MDVKVMRQTAPACVLHIETKALNIGTEAKKAVYWRAFERTRARWYGKIARTVGGEYKDEGKTVAAAVRRSSREGMEDAARKALKSCRPDWEKMLKASYLAIGEDFAPATADSVEGKKDDAWMKYLLAYINREAGVKITQIQGTTLDAIRTQLSLGMEEGETVEEIAARLSAMYDESEAWRAMRIARTEVVSASNAASIAGARSVSDSLDKRWLSSRDPPRVRTDHLNADGQTVGMDDTFTVGGYDMQFPGDSSLGAPASEIVNCRCTITYVRK